MTLVLPAKNAPPTEQNITQLRDGLTSAIAWHPEATQPWTFYDELDPYLGPWGPQGYPIGYGKFYCQAFNLNARLRANPTTHEWVRQTTVLLQESLRDFVVERFHARTLAQLTEAELRRHAFLSHASCYDRGGLARVVLVAPQMLPIVAMIPSAEFDPRSASFGPTVLQVFQTLDLVVPQVRGMVGSPGATARTLLRSSMRQHVLQPQEQGRALGDIIRAISAGHVDNITLLNRITQRLNQTQFADRTLAALAQQAVRIANNRKRLIAQHYRTLLQTNPALRPQLDAREPGWSLW